MKREDVLQQAILPDLSHQTTAQEIDKRRHARFPVSISAEVVETKTRTRVTGRVTDLGVGGCYVDAMSTFSEGTEVEVLLQWQERSFHMRALVSYAVNGRSVGMGLSFTSTSDDEGATLLDWVSTLGGEASPQPLRIAEPAVASIVKTKLMKTHRLEDILDELIALLVRKQLLTESEGVQLRNRLSE